jgi:hypothetical protein
MDVSIITINYNSSKHTLACIQSILEQTSTTISYEIIIIDNASENADYEQLLTGLKTIVTSVPIQAHRSVINTGFGGGNMLGVQHATGSYYAFLNNDILLRNDCLSCCIDFIKAQAAAVVAPMQLDEHGNYISSFDYFLTIKTALLGRRLLHTINPTTYPDRTTPPKKPQRVDCVAGSFMFIDGNAFDNIGGFDTNIFLYYEETDLCYRILKQSSNGTCYLLPHASYTHFSGTSTKKSVLIKGELKRSMLYVLKKHSSIIGFNIFQCLFILKWLFKTAVKPSYLPILKHIIAGDSPAFSLKNTQQIKRIK